MLSKKHYRILYLFIPCSKKRLIKKKDRNIVSVHAVTQYQSTPEYYVSHYPHSCFIHTCSCDAGKLNRVRTRHRALMQNLIKLKKIKELISARQMSHEHDSKDLDHFW